MNRVTVEDATAEVTRRLLKAGARHASWHIDATGKATVTVYRPYDFRDQATAVALAMDAGADGFDSDPATMAGVVRATVTVEDDVADVPVRLVVQYGSARDELAAMAFLNADSAEVLIPAPRRPGEMETLPEDARDKWPASSLGIAQ